MKNRIIGLILLISMLCTLCVLADSEAVSDAEPKKLELLASLGITDETDETDSLVTRGVFVKLCNMAFNENTETKNKVQCFTDLTENHYLYNDIMHAKNRGLIKGNQEGKFFPDDYITLEGAYTILIRAMGYEKAAESTSYMLVAKSLKLLENVNKNAAEPIEFIDAKNLIYNMLFAYAPDTVYLANGGTNLQVGRHRFLYDIWEVEEAEGILESEGYMSLKGIYSKNNDVVINNETYIPRGINLTGLFGMNLRFYYKVENGEKILIFAYETKNRVIESTGDDCVGTEGNTFAYYSDNNREVSVKLGIYTSYFYNAKRVDQALFKTKCKVSGADIKIIDNNDDGVYEYAIIYDPEIYAGGFIDKEEMAISGEGKGIIKLNDYERYDIVSSAGKKIPFSEIDAKSRLAIYTSSDKKYPAVIVKCDVTVSGKLNKTNAKDKSVALESGEVFKVSGKSKVKFNELEIGKTYTFYLDSKKRVIDAEESLANGIEGVYIIGSKSDAFGSVTMKIMRENGDIGMFELAKRINLRKSDGTQKRVDEKNAISEINSASVLDLAYTKFVFVKFNADNEISEIIQICEDITKPYHLQEFEHNYFDQKRRWLRSKFSFENQIQLKSGTKVFAAPYSELPVQEDKFYSVMGTDVFKNDDTYFICEMTPRADNQLAGIPVVIKENELAADYFLIECPEGSGFEAAQTKYGLIYGFYNKYDEEDEESVTMIQLLDHKGSQLEVKYKGSPGEYIEIGDIVQINAVKDVNDDDVLIYYDRSMDKINYFTYYDRGTGVNEIGWRYYAFRLARGKVLKISGDYAYCELCKDSEVNKNKEYLDLNKGSILKLTPGENEGYETKSVKYLKEGDEIFVMMLDGNINFVVDYEGVF